MISKLIGASTHLKLDKSTYSRWSLLCDEKYREEFSCSSWILEFVTSSSRYNYRSIGLRASPRIRDDSCRYIETPVIDGLENLKVCDLMLPEERRWDYWDLLETLFLPRDVLAVGSTSLTNSASCWRYDDLAL
jgi:hypothetical protein